MKKIMYGNQNKLTELFAETLRPPLIEISAILKDRLQFWKCKQRLKLAQKWQQIEQRYIRKDQVRENGSLLQSHHIEKLLNSKKR
ncbi:MAG: hypothetical protein WC484_07495 [Candidatus Omnitrophota bacterium]